MKEVEIIPAVLARDVIALRTQVEHVADLDTVLHIDLADGIFVPDKTLLQPEEYAEVVTQGMTIELHLMVTNPIEVLQRWSDVFDIFSAHVHCETVTPQQWADLRNKYPEEVLNLAIRPETPIEVLKGYSPAPLCVLVLGVEPGKMGQEQLPETHQRIQAIRKIVMLEHLVIDGGVNPKTLPSSVAAGATIAICGGYIQSSADPGGAIEQLQASLGSLQM